ncbi:hypothetical protein J6590_066072 [Homalodisca vitripennis]|nr:hypothetical protein J6590_066072 [Homalodisca vitripennis]
MKFISHEPIITKGPIPVPLPFYFRHLVLASRHDYHWLAPLVTDVNGGAESITSRNITVYRHLHETLVTLELSKEKPIPLSLTLPALMGHWPVRESKKKCNGHRQDSNLRYL